MGNPNRTHTWTIAFGGIQAALAVVIMMWGTLIPGTSYLCPLICLILAEVVLQCCGMGLTWMWSAVVALLSLLLSSDKEAAIVLLFLGYYPMVKVKLDKMRHPFLWKLTFFNLMLGSITCVTMFILGIDFCREHMTIFQIIFFSFVFMMGNVLLFLTDHFLDAVIRVMHK